VIQILLQHVRVLRTGCLGAWEVLMRINDVQILHVGEDAIIG